MNEDIVNLDLPLEIIRKLNALKVQTTDHILEQGIPKFEAENPMERKRLVTAINKAMRNHFLEKAALFTDAITTTEPTQPSPQVLETAPLEIIKPQNILSNPYSTLSLSVRSEAAVVLSFPDKETITVKDITSLTEDDLLALPNCGRTTVDEIIQKLLQYGLRLDTGASENPWGIAAKDDINLFRPMSDLTLSERTKNGLIACFKTGTISSSWTSAQQQIINNFRIREHDTPSLGDIIQLPKNFLLSLPNFGLKSLNELIDELGCFQLKLGTNITDWQPENFEKVYKKFSPRLDRLQAKEAQDRLLAFLPDTPYKLEQELAAIVKMLQLPHQKNAEMWTLFWGWDGKGKKTLEEVGTIYGVTRERIRQIIEKIQLRWQERPIPLPQKSQESFDYIETLHFQKTTNLPDQMVARGITEHGFELTGLFELFDLFGVPSSKQVKPLGRNRTKFVGLPSEFEAIKYTLHQIRRACSRQGFASLKDIYASPENSLATTFSYEQIEKLLECFDEVICLNKESAIYYIATQRNRLRSSIIKMLLVTSPLSLQLIKDGLRRNNRIEHVLNSKILKEYCSTSKNFNVSSNMITINPTVDHTVSISENEQILVDALKTQGSNAHRNDIKALCLEQGMNETTFNIFLSSRVFVENTGPSTYSIRGTQNENPIDEANHDNISTPQKTSSTGFTPARKFWMFDTITSSILDSGTIEISGKAASELSEEYKLYGLNGQYFGTIKNTGQMLTGIGRVLFMKGADSDDHYVIVFDNHNQRASIEIGSYELLQKAIGKNGLSFDEPFISAGELASIDDEDTFEEEGDDETYEGTS